MKTLFKIFAVIICDIPLLTLSKSVKKDDLDRIIPNILPGDIIVSTDRLYPLWNAVMLFIAKSRYSHSAIVINQQEVIESCSFGFGRRNVIRNTIEKHIKGNKSFCIIHPNYLDSDTCNMVIKFTEEQVGKPYNFSFKSTEGKSYCCTELISDAMIKAGFRFKLFKCFLGEGVIPDEFLKIGERQTLCKQDRTRNSSLLNIFITVLIFVIILSLLFFLFCLSLFVSISIAYLALLIGGGIQYFIIRYDIKL